MCRQFTQFTWRRMKGACAVLAIIVGAWFVPAVDAAVYYAGGPSNVPALNGLDVVYPQLNESSVTDPSPLYGAPLLSPPNPLSNVLKFRNLTSFGAFSIGGSPSLDYIDGQLNVEIDAKPGKAIDSISLYEFGDYTLGRLLGTNDAAVKALSPGLLVTVLEIDGLPVVQPVIVGTVAYSPSGGDFSITGGDPWSGVWSANASINLAATFGAGHVTKLAVSLDNQMLAASQADTSAMIVKKGVDIGITASDVIPEPGTAILVALFLPMILSRRPGRGSDAARTR